MSCFVTHYLKLVFGTNCCTVMRCRLVAGIGDALHAHEPHAAHAAHAEVPVLSGPHVHHPSSVLGLLVHQPVAVHHVAGLAVGHAVAVHEVLAVLHQLVHLTLEVVPLVDPRPVGALVHGDHAAGPYAVAHANHALIVGVLAPPHEVLVPHEVGAVVDHEAAVLHPAGVAAAHVGGQPLAVEVVPSE